MLSPTGNLLAVGSRQEFALWDVQTQTVIHRFIGHSDAINEIVFSPNGQMLASGSFDFTIKLWNLQTSCEIKTLRGYSGIDSLTFSPLEPILASGSRDGTIQLWDLETMEEIHSFRGHQEEVSALAFTPDGKLLASSGKLLTTSGASSNQHEICLWKLERN